MENIHFQRVEALRTLMRGKGWDAVILTGSDPHCSEYPAERWKQVEWLSGFTGEAGDIVVTLDHAGLWTDTRYFIQAEAQLRGTGIVLHKTRIPEQVLIPEWLDINFSDEAIIAVDGLCQSVEAISALPGRFSVASVPDLISTLWEDRPEIPCTPIFTVDPGESRADKISWLREVCAEHGCDSMLVTALDETAWILNVRASDIAYNPLVISYLVVSMESVKWYVHEGSPAELSADGVEILPYEDIALDLSEMSGPLMVDPQTLNYHIYRLLCDSGVEMVQVPSPVALRKSIKNQVEIEGFRKAHLLDGIAMEKFLYWLEKSVPQGISEWDAAVRLGELRSEMEGCQGDSFETISAYGKGAALPHYVTPHENAPMLEPHGLYLNDSGAQYLFGTTDITRTVPLGPCTDLEREDYTLVLKGHIDLAMAIFPEGTAGCQIDALARGPLWMSGRNFGHGTGHGVGYFLGVHEGPQSIRQNFNSTPMYPGMVTSDEPGIYREGLHGVRHENLILCTEAGRNEFGRWLRFETLTLCHFDTSVIELSLMDRRELEWLDNYNAGVYDMLSPYLTPEIADWLKEKTRPIAPDAI